MAPQHRTKRVAMRRTPHECEVIVVLHAAATERDDVGRERRAHGRLAVNVHQHRVVEDTELKRARLGVERNGASDGHVKLLLQRLGGPARHVDVVDVAQELRAKETADKEGLWMRGATNWPRGAGPVCCCRIGGWRGAHTALLRDGDCRRERLAAKPWGRATCALDGRAPA